MDNDNLTSLQHLTDENVLLILEQRYKSNKIYTYSGHSLISINPYTKLPIYGQNVIYAYTEDNLNKENKSECKNEANETLFYPAQEAHIYSMAENAIKSLCITNKVTIIISGESGSGKTMNNNFILEYIIRRTNDFEVTNLNKNFNFKINEFLLAINPILEAFGNAKTILNENSSRFGKKLDLYLENDRIVGAEIFIYLLEKNRVTNVSKEEANFHIFNYFCAYKNLDVKSEFFNIEKDNENHKLKYKEILNCFKLLEFDDIESLENILLGIIYLGALKIKNCNDLYVIEKDENFFNCINFLEIEEQQLIFFFVKN
ncbi:class II myosin [Gurleya vavrai]